MAHIAPSRGAKEGLARCVCVCVSVMPTTEGVAQWRRHLWQLKTTLTTTIGRQAPHRRTMANDRSLSTASTYCLLCEAPSSYADQDHLESKPSYNTSALPNMALPFGIVRATDPTPVGFWDGTSTNNYTAMCALHGALLSKRRETSEIRPHRAAVGVPCAKRNFPSGRATGRFEV